MTYERSLSELKLRNEQVVFSVVYILSSVIHADQVAYYQSQS